MNNVIADVRKTIGRRNKRVVQSVVIELIGVNGVCDWVAF